MDLEDTYENHQPYFNILVDVDAITKVVIRDQKAQTDKPRARKPVPEAYTKEPAPFTAEDLTRAQACDCLYRMFRDTVGMPGTEYSINAKGLLVRTSLLDKSVQFVAPEAMRNRIMYFAHNSVHAGYPVSS